MKRKNYFHSVKITEHEGRRELVFTAFAKVNSYAYSIIIKFLDDDTMLIQAKNYNLPPTLTEEQKERVMPKLSPSEYNHMLSVAWETKNQITNDPKWRWRENTTK